MRAPSEFRVRESSGKWYVDEHRDGLVYRNFRRFSTEAEAQAEAKLRTDGDRALTRFLAKRAEEAVGGQS